MDQPDEPAAPPADDAPDPAREDNAAQPDEGVDSASQADDDEVRDALGGDLESVVEQARRRLGPSRSPVAAGGNRLLRGVNLPVPGWAVAAWDTSGGAPGAPIEPTDDSTAAGGTCEDLRLVWLADTGHLLWLSTSRDSDNLKVILADTPRSFRGCVCEQPDVGEAVWDAMVARLPALAACPLGFDAWSLRAPRRLHPGGPSLLADPSARDLEDELADQIRRVHDPVGGNPQQTWFSWSTASDDYRVGGVFAATATERHFDDSDAIPPDAIRHFILVSLIGTWFTYTTLADGTATVREYDTLGDLYRFQVAGRPADDVFHQMWNNLAARLPLARAFEQNPLTRWTR